MNFLLNRRRFIQTTSSALAVGALSSVAGRASAQSAGEVRVMVGGGDWGKANIEAYVKPFEAETGIKVTAITDQIEMAQIELMTTTNNVTVDVININQGAALPAAAKGQLEEIDYSIYKKEELDGIIDFAKQPFGVAALIYSYVMVYNTESFPADKPRPTNWAEYWDVEKFPGVRVNGGVKSGHWAAQ